VVVDNGVVLEMLNKRIEMDCILRDCPDDYIFEALVKDWEHAEYLITQKLNQPLATLAGVEPFG